MSRFRMANATRADGHGTGHRAAGAKRVVISSFDSPGHPHYNGGGAVVVEKLARWLSADFEVTVVTAARRGRTEVRDGIRYRYLPAAWPGARAGQLLFHGLLPVAARRVPHDLWIESFTPPVSTSFLPLFLPRGWWGSPRTSAASRCGADIGSRFSWSSGSGCGSTGTSWCSTQPTRRWSAVTPGRRPSGWCRTVFDRRPLDERRLGHGEHILFLGRTDIWHKGLDLLLAAYDRSALAMPLLVAGAGTRRDERNLQALLATTGGDVRWLGHVVGQQKHELLERSAFVVLPSRHEAFGLSALEGMAYGKPVLHFDLPSLRWIEGGLRVRPFDVDALAREMRTLAGDQGARRELGRTAHAAAERFGWEHTAERYLALARQWLDAPAAGPGKAEGSRP